MSDPVAREAAAISHRAAGVLLAALLVLPFWGFVFALFLPFAWVAVIAAGLAGVLAVLRSWMVRMAGEFEREAL